VGVVGFVWMEDWGRDEMRCVMMGRFIDLQTIKGNGRLGRRVCGTMVRISIFLADFGCRDVVPWLRSNQTLPSSYHKCISHYTPTNLYTTRYAMYQMIFSNRLHLVVSSLRQDAPYTPLHDKIKRQCTDYKCHGGVYMMMCWDDAPYAMLWGY
jgi:hypothetical protein